MTDLSSLIARLEAGSGTDMALAREIMCGLGGWHRVTPSQRGNKHGGYIAPQDWNGCHSDGSPVLDSLHGTDIHRDVPDVLGSLDAALAFADSLLRTYSLTMIVDPSGEGAQLCWWPEGLSGEATVSTEAAHSYLTRAVLIATLRALQAKATP